MKQKDLALIVVIVIVSAVMSLLISSAVISPSKNKKQQAEVVEPITADFPKPDERYFSKEAFDPTKTIVIGQNANTDPFKSTKP
jgi:hypothetical protein